MKNTVLSEFLGCMSAVHINDENELQKFKEFAGINNLFTKGGNVASQISVPKYPVVFYRDVNGMYVDYAREKAVSAMNYKIYSFNEAFKREPVMEQRTLFGDDNAPGIHMPDEDLIVDPMDDGPIDIEVNEVQNELSLKEALNQLTVGAVTPAACDGNLLDFKDIVIEIVKKKENIVVTKDNFIEMKEVVTDLNGKAKILKDQRASFNKEIKKFTDPYSNAFSEIINTLENVSKSLNTNIKVFEDEEKKALKKNIYDKTIDPMLNMLCEKEMISKELIEKFEFKDSWLNKSSFTKSGDYTKKVKDEMNAEFERLCNLYNQEKNDIATINSTVKQLSIAHHLDAELKADTYVELYKKGMAMPEIQERINRDVEMIKRAVEKEADKKAQKIASEQQNVQQAQQSTIQENVSDAKNNQSNIVNLTDDKTGEIIGKGDLSKIMMLVADTPEKFKGKTYTYTYTFSGSFGVIKTFSNMLKLLSMIFKDFKYERVGK